MPIKKCEDCEYSVLIADLMVTLDSMDVFLLKIWTGGKELPFEFTEEHELVFLQEGIRTQRTTELFGESRTSVGYIFYDTIDNIQVFDYDNDREYLKLVRSGTNEVE